MNFVKIYDQIVARGKLRQCRDAMYEKHHIIPRCLGGSNDKENLVLLTPREHYVAHQLLVKIHPSCSKLIYAARMMLVKHIPHNGSGRSNNRLYAWLREKWIERHPTKDPVILEKLKAGIKKYYVSDEWHEKNNRRIESLLVKDCECGCGEKIQANKRFTGQECSVRFRLDNPDLFQKGYDLIGSKQKNFISNLTEEEKKTRLASWRGDPQKRGSSISAGKKGKQTNQQTIMGLRYSAMSDEDFNQLLDGKLDRIVKRMINLREKWKLIQK